MGIPSPLFRREGQGMKSRFHIGAEAFMEGLRNFYRVIGRIKGKANAVALHIGGGKLDSTEIFSARFRVSSYTSRSKLE